MSAVKRKKLYFTVTFPTATSPNRAFPCTLFRASYPGDDYGGVLDDVPALVTSAGVGQQIMRQNEVAAWYQRFGTNGIATDAAPPALSFVNATTVALGSTFIPGINGNPAGFSPIATRHFAVAVQRADTATQRGRLYVQRQHSFEV